jgi:hypothetical protein
VGRDRELAGKITVFFLAVMPMPPQPSDPPPDVLERFVLAMHESISSDLEKLERIHLS